MCKTVTQKIVVSVPDGATNVQANVVGCNVEIFYKISTVAKPNETNVEELFHLVEASKLSINDDFLKREPKTKTEAQFMKRIIAAINFGVKDFSAQAMDPSVDENGRIYFRKGSKPGVGKSAKWWLENAPKYRANCRPGTPFERDAFLATLIKRGLATWEQVCNHSEEIGHYWDSKDAKHDFELTGSRPVGEFYDLGNAYKITYDEKACVFWHGGGCYGNHGYGSPLSDVCDGCNPFGVLVFSVGWLVLSSSTDH